MRKTCIVLCEDDDTQSDLYTALCREVSVKNNIRIELKEYKSGSDLLFDLENPKFYNSLDVLLLDISMPGLSGIETAKEARKIGYNGIIIFISGSREYFEQAFDVGAFHYIVKGEHDFERFEKILLKAIEQADNLRQDVIVLSCGGELKQIEIRQVQYFEIAQRILTVYYGNEMFEFTSTLEKLEHQLTDKGFQRIHRHFLISLSYVKSISYKEVVLQSGAVLPVGRKYYPELKKSAEMLIV